MTKLGSGLEHSVGTSCPGPGSASVLLCDRGQILFPLGASVSLSGYVGMTFKIFKRGVAQDSHRSAAKLLCSETVCSLEPAVTQ